MGLTREEAHKLVDQIFNWEAKQPAEGGIIAVDPEGEVVEDTPKRVLPEGLRVVRTKTSGDRVYLLDEVNKTRQWLTTPEVLEGKGFTTADVVEVPDDELLRYQMGSAIYKLDQ